MQQLILGQRGEIHLCRECAHERGISINGDRLEFSLAGFIAGLRAKALEMQQANDTRVCPVCGRSLFQIKKDRACGCPECYAAFSTEIKQLMESSGITGQYSGSYPLRLGQVHSVLSDRMTIRTKLEESVAKEDYEKAAFYRDRLRALETSAVAAADKTGGSGQ